MALSVELARATPQEIGQFVSEDRISAQVGLEIVLSRGMLAAGTVESKREYQPRRAMNKMGGSWRSIANGENGGSLKVVRASRVAGSVITCAVLGDCNITDQRGLLGLSLVESDIPPRYGWRIDKGSQDGYRIWVDKRLWVAVREDPEAIVGVADIFDDDGSWRELNGPNDYTDTYEPNHYASTRLQGRIGSIPVTGAVFLGLPNIETI